MINFSVHKVPLWMACYGDDICMDANAACQEGQCICINGYFDKAGVCCELYNYIIFFNPYFINNYAIN